MPRTVQGGSSSSAATASSYYNMQPALSAGSTALDVRELRETVEVMRHEIRCVSKKMDIVIGLIDTLRQAVHLVHPVQPASLQ